MSNITHEKLEEILCYESDTGLFRWRTKRGRAVAGAIAGSLHHKGYIHIEIFGKHYAAHRLAWFYVHKVWPSDQIDHINRNRADNRILNLREASNGENRANSKQCNITGYKGVSFKKWLKENPFEAKITHNKKVIYIGCFPTAEMANAAYMEKAKELHGSFARC